MRVEIDELSQSEHSQEVDYYQQVVYPGASSQSFPTPSSQRLPILPF